MYYIVRWVIEFLLWGQNYLDFWLNMTYSREITPQKLSIILEYKMSENWELSKNVKRIFLIKPISLNENQYLKYYDELSLKVQF